MAKINEITASKLLIVEGNHERDFFVAWFTRLAIQDIQTMPIGGKTLLSNNLQSLVKQPQFPHVASLGIVRDADDNPNGAFQSVCTTLSTVSIPVPAKPWIWHTTQNPANTASSIRICVIILPDGQNHGALEELLMQTVIGDVMFNDATGLVTTAVNKLAVPASTRKPPPVHRHGKAKAHAFLSTFEEPDKDQGKAAGKGVWDFNHTALAPLKQILQQM